MFFQEFSHKPSHQNGRLVGWTTSDFQGIEELHQHQAIHQVRASQFGVEGVDFAGSVGCIFSRNGGALGSYNQSLPAT